MEINGEIVDKYGNVAKKVKEVMGGYIVIEPNGQRRYWTNDQVRR